MRVNLAKFYGGDETAAISEWKAVFSIRMKLSKPTCQRMRKYLCILQVFPSISSKLPVRKYWSKYLSCAANIRKKIVLNIICSRLTIQIAITSSKIFSISGWLLDLLWKFIFQRFNAFSYLLNFLISNILLLKLLKKRKN